MRTHAKRLLFVINDAGFFLSHRLPLALGARDAGYEVHVATPMSPEVRRINEEGFLHHAIEMQRGKSSIFSEINALRSLYRLYRKVKPDVVHNVTIKPVLYGGIAARMAKIPAVVSAISGLGYVFISEGVLSNLRRSLVKPIYRAALAHQNSRVILQNPDDIQLFQHQRLMREKDAVLIRGSGVDCDRFVPLPEPDGQIVVTLASRMLWDKGVGEFVEAARSLGEAACDARFILVGGVDSCNPAAISEEQLKTWVDDGVVEWWGHQEDMVDVFNRSHIVCLPSYREGLPKVLLEAAACGRPIVATDVPGCREIAVHGENGLLVRPRCASDIAGALKQLIENPILRQQMGWRGRAMVERDFSVGKVLEATMGVYQTLVENGSFAAAPDA